MGDRYYPVIDMIATGQNITVLRKARGLSVSDLQEYFGFEAPQAIYKWQKGQSLPSTDNLYALAFLFEVSIEDILIPVGRRVQQILPQDDSCGSGRFGGLFSIYSSQSKPSVSPGSSCLKGSSSRWICSPPKIPGTPYPARLPSPS